MSKYTITPFHDGITNMPALNKKFHDCDKISQIIGRDANGHHINIINYWDNTENKALVYHNKKYVHIGDSKITVNNILEAFGLSYLDANVIKHFQDYKPVAPNNKILDMPLLETRMSLIELIPNIHNIYDNLSGDLCDDLCGNLCGDGIDSDDYDSD